MVDTGPVTTSARSASERLLEYFEVTAVVGVLTAIAWELPLTYRAIGLVYLVAVQLMSLRVGRWPVIYAAVASSIGWIYIVIPPHFSFSIQSWEDGLMVGTYFVVALVSAELASRIREHRRAESSRKLLEESERLYRTLLDSVSHELRTPLSVLQAAAEDLKLEANDRQNTLADEILTATARLNRLVGNLLNQSRLESGILKPLLDWCDARDIVNAARRSTADLLAGRAVQMEIPEELPFFMADAPLLEQAMANLLVNAARHTPPGSPIGVRVGVDVPRRRIKIAVADHGPGLIPEIRDHLFQKFQRGSADKAGGLGLGLSIVRGLVAAHAGEVTAENNPDGGATFTICVPYIPHETLPEE
jgi:two-component system sensor histidine kinase KdpD